MSAVIRKPLVVKIKTRNILGKLPNTTGTEHLFFHPFFHTPSSEHLQTQEFKDECKRGPCPRQPYTFSRKMLVLKLFYVR